MGDKRVRKGYQYMSPTATLAHALYINSSSFAC